MRYPNAAICIETSASERPHSPSLDEFMRLSGLELEIRAPNPSLSGQDANPSSGQDANPSSGQDANPSSGQDANPSSGQDANSPSQSFQSKLV
jgi:hypothetical protein